MIYKSQFSIHSQSKRNPFKFFFNDWIENNKCLICDDTETTDHLFFQLVYPEPFWLQEHNIFYG